MSHAHTWFGPVATSSRGRRCVRGFDPSRCLSSRRRRSTRYTDDSEPTKIDMSALGTSWCGESPQIRAPSRLPISPLLLVSAFAGGSCPRRGRRCRGGFCHAGPSTSNRRPRSRARPASRRSSRPAPTREHPRPAARSDRRTFRDACSVRHRRGRDPAEPAFATRLPARAASRGRPALVRFADVGPRREQRVRTARAGRRRPAAGPRLPMPAPARLTRALADAIARPSISGAAAATTVPVYRHPSVPASPMLRPF